MTIEPSMLIYREWIKTPISYSEEGNYIISTYKGKKINALLHPDISLRTMYSNHMLADKSFIYDNSVLYVLAMNKEVDRACGFINIYGCESMYSKLDLLKLCAKDQDLSKLFDKILSLGIDSVSYNELVKVCTGSSKQILSKYNPLKIQI